MKAKKFTEEQIIMVLKQHERGVSAKDICRQHGLAPATLYRWKTKFGGMEVSDAKKLRALEDENRRLKKLVADNTVITLSLNGDVFRARWCSTWRYFYEIQ